MGSPRWTWIGGAALLMALSYGVGHWQAPREASPSSQERPEGGARVAMRPLVVERTVAGASGLDRDELRAVVREELARDIEQRAADGGEDVAVSEEAKAERAARAERSAKAATVASAAVTAGIDDGLWDDRDRQALREQLPYLDERATHAVLEPLFQAINAQRVKLDGPPF